MTEWIDVPVAEVQVGDEVKVDGYGKVKAGKEAMSFVGTEWWGVLAVDERDAHIRSLLTVVFEIRRSSIVAARRRKPEPQPKPGDWRCATTHWSQEPKEVYRASGGWSRDTRTGEPWVMRVGDPATLTIPVKVGSIQTPLEAVARTVADYAASLKSLAESWADYYRRIGLDVRPVDRRKR